MGRGGCGVGVLGVVVVGFIRGCGWLGLIVLCVRVVGLFGRDWGVLVPFSLVGEINSPVRRMCHV